MKKRLFISLFWLVPGLDSRVVFQENFEEPEPKFDTYEIRRASVGEIQGSNAVWMDTMNSGYFRFKIPFETGNNLQFDFLLKPCPWGKTPPEFFDLNFLTLDFYKTLSSSYSFEPLFSLALRKAADDSLPALAVILPGNSLLGALPVAFEETHTFRLHYGRDSDSTLSFGRMEVDGRELARLAPGPRMGDLTYLTFSGDAGRNLRIALDNLTLSTASDSLRTAPPKFTWSVTPGRKISLHLPHSGSDSLVRFMVSDGGAGNPFPLVKRDLPAERCRPFVFTFPFPAGTFLAKAAVLKKNGLWTDYSAAQTFTVPAAGAGSKEPAILGVDIADEISGEPAEALEREHWYVMKVRLSQARNCFALLWLHHAHYIQAGDRERGGFFSREMNYIFNFSLTDEPWLYGTREDIKERTVRVDGGECLYINDRDRFFKVDTLAKTVRVRFKLLSEARTGPWQFNGYVEVDPPLRSPLFVKSYRVLSDLEVAQRQGMMRKKARRRLQFSLAAAAAALAAGYGYRRWRRRPKALAEDLLHTLTTQGFFLRHPAYKHRHLAVRAQKFILENYTRNISLFEVAENSGVTPAWAGRVFKQATGMTVVAFLHRLRVDRAKNDLAETHLPITDIAMAAGFANVDHFRRVFKEHTGLLPSDFREKATGRA